MDHAAKSLHGLKEEEYCNQEEERDQEYYVPSGCDWLPQYQAPHGDGKQHNIGH